MAERGPCRSCGRSHVAINDDHLCPLCYRLVDNPEPKLRDLRILARILKVESGLELGNNCLKPIVQDEVIEYIQRGYSRREIERICGISDQTVLRYLELEEATNGPVVCQCGKEVRKHRGTCSYRYARLPNRKKFMAELHQRQRVKSADRTVSNDLRAFLGLPPLSLSERK